MAKYTGHVGKKFHKDGTARKFPGNTIICHVPKDSPQFTFLVEYQKYLKTQSWAKKFSFLPSSSFHMTVFEGICEQVRKPNHWFSSLPLDASLQETDTFLTDKWRKIENPDSFSMQATRILIGSVITLRLKPSNSEENAKLRAFRDLLAKETTIKMPNHSNYGFHISFAYQIEKLSMLERIKVGKFMIREAPRVKEGFGIMKTNPPELTFFENMTHFAHIREES